jgi:hypothetical protein
VIPNSLGKRKLVQVQFPSQKIQLHEDEARHFRKAPAFYAVDESNFPALFFDQHASMVKSSDLLHGFNPGAPANPFPQLITYDPQPWDAPSQPLAYRGKCRWTRGGLQGLDLGKMGTVGNTSELNTSGW